MSARAPFLLHLYRAGVTVFEPAAAGLLLWRERKGKEDRDRLRERQGWPSRARPDGHLAWVHGASIGETLSLGPGAIVSLNRLAGEPVDLLVNGRPIARGEVVVIDEEFGLRITDVGAGMARLGGESAAA